MRRSDFLGFRDFQGEFIFGEQLYVMGQGAELLNDNYNDHLEGKLIVVAEELGVNKESFRPLWEKIKSFATNPRMLVSKKYFSKYRIHNFAFFFIMSNQEYAVCLDADDRRYACLEVNDREKKNFAFWTSLRAKCFNQETGDLFFSWLYKTTEFDDVDIRNLPNTELRQRIIENSLSAGCRFLKDHKEGRDAVFEEKLENKRTKIREAAIRKFTEKLENKHDSAELLQKTNDEKIEAELLEFTEQLDKERKESQWIQSSDLCEAFKEWCRSRNESLTKIKVFLNQIIKHIDKKHTHRGSYYNQDSIRLPGARSK